MAWLREPVGVLALGLAAAAEAAAVHGAHVGRLALAALLAASLLWRRTYPQTVLVVVTAAFVVQLPWAGVRLFETTFAGYICMVVAAYSVGRHSRRRLARWVGFGGALVVGLVIGVSDRSAVSGLLAAGILAAPVLVGEAVRVRAAARRQLVEQAREIEDSTAAVAEARTLETRALAAADMQRALDGRLRSMLSAAGRANQFMATDPTHAGASIAEIEDEGRLALAEMRRTLRGIREPDEVVTASIPETEAGDPATPRPVEPGVTIAAFGLAVAEAVALAAETGTAVGSAAALAVAMAAPLVLRRTWPVLAAVLSWAAACALVHAVGIAVAVIVVGMLLAGSAGAARDGRRRLGGLVVGIVGVVAVNLAGGLTGLGDYAFPAVLIGLAWLGGTVIGQQEVLLDEVEEQAGKVRRLRDDRAAAAAVHERLRLARELHDVVAHHLVVMVVQAGAARRTAERGRPGAVEALDAIEATGAEARAELGSLLALVAPALNGSGPAHGMSELQRLVDRVRATGLEADLHVEGRPRSLPAGLDMVAHRVIQESLTNVIRHAGATRVEVRVGYLEDRLTLEISDNGRGMGITGMRERVELYGGRFELETSGRQGVLVRVDLPLDGVAAAVPT